MIGWECGWGMSCSRYCCKEVVWMKMGVTEDFAEVRWSVEIDGGG